MVDPDIMNQHDEQRAARGELPGYDKKLDDMSGYQEFVPPDNIQLNMQNGESYNYENQPPQQQAQQQEERIQFNPNDDSQFRQPQNYQDFQPPHMEYADGDAPIFPGGPLHSQILSWKQQYNDKVFIIDDLPCEEEIFIYRNMERFEYKIIMTTPNTDPLMREEMMCEQFVLWPPNYDYSRMSKEDAGLPTVIANHIMQTSGFTKASVPRRL